MKPAVLALCLLLGTALACHAQVQSNAELCPSYNSYRTCNVVTALVNYRLDYAQTRRYFCAGEPLASPGARTVPACVSRNFQSITRRVRGSAAAQANLRLCLEIACENELVRHCNPVRPAAATFTLDVDRSGYPRFALQRCGSGAQAHAGRPAGSMPPFASMMDEVRVTPNDETNGGTVFPTFDPCEVYQASERSCGATR
jgi:hypothetical protein